MQRLVRRHRALVGYPISSGEMCLFGKIPIDIIALDIRLCFVVMYGFLANWFPLTVTIFYPFAIYNLWHDPFLRHVRWALSLYWKSVVLSIEEIIIKKWFSPLSLLQRLVGRHRALVGYSITSMYKLLSHSCQRSDPPTSGASRSLGVYGGLQSIGLLDEELSVHTRSRCSWFSDFKANW